MTFVQTSDSNFIVSDKYFWLCRLEKETWSWTYDSQVGFGIRFDHEDDAIAFKLMFGAL